MRRFHLLSALALSFIPAAALADEIVLDGRRIGPPPLPDTPSGGGSDLSALQAVINQYKVWQVGQTLTICFFGGDKDLRALFASAASEWNAVTSGLVLDLGSSPEYRNCIQPDGQPVPAQIRVAFDRNADYSGDWSQLGPDSLLFNFDQPSMNIGTVRDESLAHTLVYTTEKSLKGTMLHELGHALGLQHEHQSPGAKCEEELLWDEKVYPALAKAPNNWDHDKVDFNLRPLFRSDRLRATAYDPKSIMHYSLPIEWFRSPDATCAVAENDELSQTDLTTIAGIYPKTIEEQHEYLKRLGGKVLQVANELKLGTAAAKKVEQDIEQALPAGLRQSDLVPKISQCIVSGDISGNTGGVSINFGGCNVQTQ